MALPKLNKTTLIGGGALIAGVFIAYWGFKKVK